MNKPIFRFSGKPHQIKNQHEIAQMIQQFYLLLVNEGLAERVDVIRKDYANQIEQVKEIMINNNIEISDGPKWFARLFQ